MKNPSSRLLNYAKRIQALAETGQHYAPSDYDMDRYHELEQIAAEMIAVVTDNEIATVTTAIAEKNGYRTPKVDVRAVVFNAQHEILMVKENVDGCWSLPGGWAEVGFTPAEVAVKETAEEAGMKVEPVKLLAVLDKKCHNHPPDILYIYKLFIECKPMNSIIETGYETSEAGFFSLQNLPPLSTPRNTLEQIEMMFGFHHGTVNWPVIDL
jgi:ADP-ribose pyrophosphatase YjhB (NUDIX family)